MLKTFVLLLFVISVGLCKPYNNEYSDELEEKPSVTYHNPLKNSVERSISDLKNVHSDNNSHSNTDNRIQESDDDRNLFDSVMEGLKEIVLGFKVQFYKVVRGIKKNIAKVNFLIKPVSIIEEDVKKENDHDGDQEDHKENEKEINKKERKLIILPKKIEKYEENPIEKALRLISNILPFQQSQTAEEGAEKIKNHEEDGNDEEGGEKDNEDDDECNDKENSKSIAIKKLNKDYEEESLQRKKQIEMQMKKLHEEELKKQQEEALKKQQEDEFKKRHGQEMKKKQEELMKKYEEELLKKKRAEEEMKKQHEQDGINKRNEEIKKQHEIDMLNQYKDLMNELKEAEEFERVKNVKPIIGRTSYFDDKNQPKFIPQPSRPYVSLADIDDSGYAPERKSDNADSMVNLFSNSFGDLWRNMFGF